jgi:raffinose synthase
MGIFNCQGAGWCKSEKKNCIHDSPPMTLSGSVHNQDVDFLPQTVSDDWNGDIVIYTHRSSKKIALFLYLYFE